MYGHKNVYFLGNADWIYHKYIKTGKYFCSSFNLLTYVIWTRIFTRNNGGKRANHLLEVDSAICTLIMLHLHTRALATGYITASDCDFCRNYNRFSYCWSETKVFVKQFYKSRQYGKWTAVLRTSKSKPNNTAPPLAPHARVLPSNIPKLIPQSK